MDSGIKTVSSVQETETLRRQLGNWVLFKADRQLFAVGVVVAIIAVMATLISIDVLAVGPDSSVATIFGSGIVSGVVTLVTIALSINQLVFSRVSGTPGTLTDRLDGSRNLRREIEELAEQPSSPNDPATFLSMIAVTLSDRASDLLAKRDSTDWTPPPGVTSALEDLIEYGDNIDDALDEETTVSTALDTVIGTEYATNMTAVHHILNAYGSSLPAEVRLDLQALEELLESIAVVRQFYKTIALQQDFARLSRLIVYSGFIALLSAISLALVYRPDTVMISPSLLPAMVSVGTGVVLAPLVVFSVYILRAATVTRQTVSVGPFIPPDEL